MNSDRIWHTIDAQRTALCDLLDDLDEDEWRHPSLCEGWTVRDVAAHLTLQQIGLRDVLHQLATWRGGGLEAIIANAARERAAALTTREIVARIRATVGSRRRNLGVTELEPLCDALVHAQDIAIPLGRRLDLPADAAATSATRVLSMRWPPAPPSARVARGFRLTATDADFSHGDGPAVHGPVAALLLVCCGRRVALAQLTGDGVAALAARLGPPVAA